MALTTKESILKVLNAYNPWWKTGATNPSLTKTYKRFAFYDAMSKLENKSIRRTVVLTGTRRVGKTTIQYQMIDEAEQLPFVVDVSVCVGFLIQASIYLFDQ